MIERLAHALRETADLDRLTEREQEELAELLERYHQRASEQQAPNEHGESAPNADGDPWAGFYGVAESGIPDLLSQHDYYIGLEAMDPHADEE